MLWNGISGISDPIPIRQFNGLFIPDDDGYGLSDNFFTHAINFSPDKFPSISTRKGFKTIGKFGTAVLGMGIWKDTELHAIFNDGTWRRFNGTTWDQLASGLSNTARCDFTN